MRVSVLLLWFCCLEFVIPSEESVLYFLSLRKFSYKHLAQIKYILPEAVQIDKILIHDEESQCMKQDLRITLVFDVVKDHMQTSNFTALSLLFLSRVVDVFSTHSEDYDIPEAALPQPFSQENGSASPETDLQEASIGPTSSSVDTGLLEDTILMSSQIEQNSSENTAAQRVNSSPISLTVTDCHPGCSLACDSPMMNRNLEAAKLMVETPAQLTPKRATLETEDSLTAISNNGLGLEKPAKRSLDFTYEKANEYVLDNTMGKNEHLMTMQHDILQTSRSKEYLTAGNVKSNEEDEDGGNNCTVPGPDSDKSISEMRCKMSSSLCGCVTVIRHIFQSVNYFPVTKKELVFKILVNSLELVEREMAEEHLEQLELLLPNWISKTISPSGDLMYSIKKVSDISTVLADLKAIE
uniref:CDT1 Geminin-binding domain-containing protein n=1 Tax=Kalanchoe fedtschenkoi TaxID=63787 RepID=A0A7N0ZTY2_KALFE